MSRDDRQRIQHAISILDAWGQAIRNDWGSIDGRSSRSQLWEITAYLSGERDTLTLEDVGVCIKGTDGVHWTCGGYGHDCYEVIDA